MKRRIILLVLLFLSFSILSGQEISQWREDNRTGVSSETGLLKKWPDGGPALIWSNLQLPAGFSSVSFSGGLLYLTGKTGDNDMLVALDTMGQIKWQVPYGRSWTGSMPESRCTPTVEDNRVYVSSGNGDIACVDATSGRIIWSVKASEVYKGTFGEWGIAESLLIDGRKIYYTVGGPETTTLALDKTTGNLVWKTESINDGPAYVSPILISHSGRKYLINVSLRNVFAVDVATGKIAWKVDHTIALDSRASAAIWPDAPMIKCVTPLYSNGRIYVTGGYNHGGLMLKLADDDKKATVVWTDTVLDVHHGGVVLVNGKIYGSNWIDNNRGNWCCIDWETGRKMYETQWNCKGSIIAAERLLYVYDERNGNVGLVKPNPDKFDLVSSFRIKQGSGPYWAHPVIHHGKLYMRHGNALMVYNIKE